MSRVAAVHVETVTTCCPDPAHLLTTGGPTVAHGHALIADAPGLGTELDRDRFFGGRRRP